MLADPNRVPTRQSFVGMDRASARPLLVGRGSTSR
jgi:hypothetical protein